MSEQKRLEINWVGSAGGALGAVSSAVLLSSLGAAGTLAGAAIGSLCITVGGAVYSHYLSVTKQRVAAQALAARRRSRQPVAATGAGPVLEDRAEPEPVGAPEGERSSWVRDLPWKRIGLLSAALFAVSMVLIVAFELSTGRAVSTYTGGTDDTAVGTSVPGWSGTGEKAPALDPGTGAPDGGGTDQGDVPTAPGQDGQTGPEDSGGTTGQDDPAPGEDPAPATGEDGSSSEQSPDPTVPDTSQDSPQDPAPPADVPAEPAPDAVP